MPSRRGGSPPGSTGPDRPRTPRVVDPPTAAIELEDPLDQLEPLLFLLRPALERLLAEPRARGLGATTLQIDLHTWISRAVSGAPFGGSFHAKSANEAEEREAAAGGLSLTVLAMKAAAIALREHPRLNASFDPDAEELIYKHYCHIGVATDTERGLLVPTIRDVDRKSLAELGRELPEVTERARGGELGRGDMEGGSFTITNVGSIGGTAFTPIINPPQVAILGLGRAEPQPRVTGDPAHPRILPRTMLPLCLAFDHRVCDGADAARFVVRVAELLGAPERLLLHL